MKQIIVTYILDTKKILYITPVGETSDIQQIWNALPKPNEAEYQIVPLSEVSIDPHFFDSYVFDGNAFDIDFSKAKEIWLDHYRRARTPLLEKLDLEYMRADEASNLKLKKEIAAKKQALRDVTKTELPNDLEGIKNTWPEILGKNPFNS